MCWAQGGTANLAVLGGNLPTSPHVEMGHHTVGFRAGEAGGLVAHPNGPVARSTRSGDYGVPLAKSIKRG